MTSGRTKNKRRLIRSLRRSQHGNYCCWCGCPFSKEDPPTLEHLTPLAHGGGNTLDNLELAHLTCNQRRGTQPWVPLPRPRPRRLRVLPTPVPTENVGAPRDNE